MENIDIFIKAADKVRFIRSEPIGKDDAYMSTYEEFMVILTTSLLIVAIHSLHKNK